MLIVIQNNIGVVSILGKRMYCFKFEDVGKEIDLNTLKNINTFVRLLTLSVSICLASRTTSRVPLTFLIIASRIDSLNLTVAATWNTTDTLEDNIL